jgi:hypothetical protein
MLVEKCGVEKCSFSRRFREMREFFQNIYMGFSRGFLVGSEIESRFLRELRGFSEGTFFRVFLPIHRVFPIRRVVNRNECREVGSTCRVEPSRQGPAQQAGLTRKGVFSQARKQDSRFQELRQDKV